MLISGVHLSSMGESIIAFLKREKHHCVLKMQTQVNGCVSISNISGIFKTMIDHIPLSIGSVRPTQGRILAVSQVILRVAMKP